MVFKHYLGQHIQSFYQKQKILHHSLVFYDVVEKVGIIIGAFLYGFIAQITGSMRNATLFLIVFFLSGVALLLRVLKTSK